MQEYLNAAEDKDKKAPLLRSIEWDSERVKVIESQLKPLLSDYFRLFHFLISSLKSTA